jgi:dethiobiotin synthetase
MIGNGLFVSAIDTDIGKTIASSVLVHYYNANYWKPIQCGTKPQTDTQTIKNLSKNIDITCFKEEYCFEEPCSPHKAAHLEGSKIELKNINLPKSNKAIIVEGAGGIMVPLNEHDFMIDLIKRLKLDVVIVTKNYLGSLNHTFSTIKILRNYNIKIKGLIFNETSDKDLENFISSRYKVPIIARIKKMSQINETQIKKLSLTI